MLYLPPVSAKLERALGAFSFPTMIIVGILLRG